MMNLNNYAENHAKSSVLVFVLIDQKRWMKEDIVVNMKTKTHIMNAPLNETISKKPKCCIQMKLEMI